MWCRCAGDLLRVVATATCLSNLLNIKKRNREKPSTPFCSIHEPKRRVSFPSIPHNSPAIAQATATRSWRALWRESSPCLEFIAPPVPNTSLPRLMILHCPFFPLHKCCMPVHAQTHLHMQSLDSCTSLMPSPSCSTSDHEHMHFITLDLV